jgi:benzoylformate decarboxylase
MWHGNLPAKASEIRAILESYDAVFARGGKSLITIRFSEGLAVPSGCKVFQLSSDVRDRGRTSATELSCTGDIKISLTALPTLQAPWKMASHRTGRT